ncbi:acetyltransferase, ribosomal protein N-acetylase [Caulobacter sp. AP07]|uniref:GNAT family N-acetyltransferase n=1 Tax=Caulobacter sp. AP07 TaxID=1144304 RepID=UPI000271F75A|nr:GNAT family protein [Caulobacter sp. AP07]EJL33931.1 acetyltransferase, ribosomal protein N-acetylase [Caulobacter sp. AP07]
MLIETTDAHFAALIAGGAPEGLTVAEGGVETPEMLEMLRDLSATVGEEFAPNAWMIVEDGEVVGLCSLVRIPYVGDTVMIGYGVAESRRRRGIARRAVADLLDWARADYRVSVVTAETSIHNAPSQRVLEANGFTRSGERTDEEDGELFCWRVEV